MANTFMKKTQKLTSFASNRWAFLSVVGVALVFAGFAAYQMVSAQTTTSFTDPTCDPTTNPGSCNTPQPLFLTPKTGQTGPQIVETDVQIGKSGALKDLSLYGGVVLSDSTKNISTIAGYSGQAIHATSTLGHAIYGSSGGNGTGGLYGIATSATAYGVAASSGGLATYAIFADASTGGTAGKFIGPVVYQNGQNTATFNFDGSGNLNIATATNGVANGKSVTVNGSPAGGAQKIVTISNATGATTTYDIMGLQFGGNKYTVGSVKVLYRDAANLDVWKPLDFARISYKECLGSIPNGKLELSNPVANQDYRISVEYDPNTLFTCTGEDTSAPINVSISGITSSYWYTGNVTLTGTATETSGLGLTSIEFFDGATSLGTATCTSNCTAVNKQLTISWNAGAAASTYANPANVHSLSIKATSGGGTSPNSTAIANVKTFTSSDNRQVCANTTTCATTQYCCTTAQTNDGQPTAPVNKCTNITTTPPTCQPASNYCGSCQGGSGPPPEA